MKLVDHIQRWNKWRKHNTNGRLHHILVLTGLFHSPTLGLFLSNREERKAKESLERLRKGVNKY